jgi:hypothetical protein
MISSKIEWDSEAEKRLKKAPFFVRKIARNKVEKAAQAQGLTRITVEFMEKIKNREMGGA